MVSVKKVVFKSRNIDVVGHLFIPDNAPAKRNAAVVIGHPMSGVKEQASGNYAKALAEAGFYALPFDAAYQGESGGEPRFLEDPYQRSEDSRAAIDFLSAQDNIDPNRIGVLGICASGGYVSFAAQTDQRMKAVATISCANTGSLFREGMPPGALTLSALKEGLKLANDARTQEARTGNVLRQPLLPSNWSDLPKGTLWHDGGEYYLSERASYPTSRNDFCARSLDLLATFDAFQFIHMISPRPLLMIAGSEADTKYFSDDAIVRAKEPKELYVIKNATHVSLYDVDLPKAVPKLVDFFTQYLCN